MTQRLIEKLEADLKRVKRICAGNFATDRDFTRKAALGRRIRDEKAKLAKREEQK